MARSRNKKIALAALALTAALAIQLTPPTRLIASDHIDSPSITHDRSSDIADTYAFVDPNDSSKVVLIMSTQGFVVSGEHFGMAIFDQTSAIALKSKTRATPKRIPSLMFSTRRDSERDDTMATIELPDGKKFHCAHDCFDAEYATVEPVVTKRATTGASF